MQNKFKEEQSLVIASLPQEKLLWVLAQIFEIKLTTLSEFPSEYTQQEVKAFMDSIPLLDENAKIMMVKTYSLESMFACYKQLFINMSQEMNSFNSGILKKYVVDYLNNFSSKEIRALMKRIEALGIN